MSTQKIAFTGPFGDTNFGDYGMLVNNIYDIGCENIVLFTHDKNFSKVIQEAYLEDYSLEVVDIIMSDYERAEGYAYTPIEIIELIENKEEIIDNLRDVDVLIVNGGGYFNGFWSKLPRLSKLMKIIAPILIANQLNKKIVFTGNSLGPFDDEKGFFATIFGSLNNTSFAARDNLYSKMWFHQLGIEEEVTFIPDDLLFINERITDKPNKLTINSNDYIVLETFLSEKYIIENLETFKNFVKVMKEEHHLSVVFLPLNLNDGGGDQGELLKEKIPELELIDINETGYLPLQDAVSIISKAKLVMSSRYHALVIALANKVPIMSVLRERMGAKRYYYNKNSGLIRQVFNNLNLDESFVLKNDFAVALDFVANHFDELIDYQNKLIRSAEYQNNLEKLNNLREIHLKKINE